MRALDASDHEIDRLQALQRLHVDAAADHAQVAALDKLESEIARKIGVAEIVLVTRPRRQKRDQRIVALDALQELRLELLEVRSKPERPARAEHVAHELAVEKPVGKRETDARRRFGMDVDNSPRAAHIADQIGGEKVDQMFFGLRFAAGVKEGRIAENKPRRNLARLEQSLRTVEVLRDEVVKRGPLNKPALKLRPIPRSR